MLMREYYRRHREYTLHEVTLVRLGHALRLCRWAPPSSLFRSKRFSAWYGAHPGRTTHVRLRVGAMLCGTRSHRSPFPSPFRKDRNANGARTCPLLLAGRSRRPRHGHTDPDAAPVHHGSAWRRWRSGRTSTQRWRRSPTAHPLLKLVALRAGEQAQRAEGRSILARRLVPHRTGSVFE